MTKYVDLVNLKVAEVLYRFINEEVLPGIKVDQAPFWAAFGSIVNDFGPRNLQLLKIRLDIQNKIDGWHKKHQGQEVDAEAYKAFLKKINYLVDEGPQFEIGTKGTDLEFSDIAGPQLVVPVTNARYALNAANARWGSLYDALYGSDVIPDDDNLTGTKYNPARGKQVIGWSKAFLDEVFPLIEGSHSDAVSYAVVRGNLNVKLTSGANVGLVDERSFAGYKGDLSKPVSILLVNNGLHIDIRIDRNHFIGVDDLAGISDIVLEAAVTTIIDLEDSVASVDADDKVEDYRNWLGLMDGSLTSEFEKSGRKIIRKLNCDRIYNAPNGEPLHLAGRSLMLIRNVGNLMYNNAVLDAENNQVSEGIIDAICSSVIALHDLQGKRAGRNSRVGSVYIVKPKMHGPNEVRFINDLFARVEDALGLNRNTVKLGIMDEERRTTLNLMECIRAAKDRVCFINTGFLDRTGDEIHTSMEAGPVVRKKAVKDTPWISAYEDWNVDIGLSCGLQGKAQIGKGMWAMPDMMADMLKQKIEHPKSGANTAWVPSPTAAVLHATHYHRVDVFAIQNSLKNRRRATLDDLLKIPLADGNKWDPNEIQTELDNNAQSILGYVVRWVDQGIGCSKVPDITNVSLMEDRATLRISAQHIANWLHHGVCSKNQVMETMERMADVVDKQNAKDPRYRNMVPNLDSSIAFQAACDLVVNGRDQPNGYTEPILQLYRHKAKARSAV